MSALGCSGSGAALATPRPAVAASLPAQSEFRALEDRFVDLPQTARPALEHDLRAFLARHGSDGRARIAALYLAWSLLDERRLLEVQALVEPVRKGPPGAPRDFADVVEAAVLRRQGKIREALALLSSLRGKLADPIARELHSEELVRALVDARRFEETLAAMLDWAEQASPTDRETVVASIEGLLRGMPASALEAGVLAFSGERPEGESQIRTEARKWLRATSESILVRVALTQQDPSLARRLVDSATVRPSGDDTREALEALAATSAVAPRVVGRAIGVVLDVVDETSRRRSADLVAGMTRALGLPRTASRADAVHLLTRDASEQGDVERALASLAGDGAAILVAGVTDGAAVEASLFAERSGIPVIVVRRLPGGGAGAPHSFVLGEDPIAEEEAVKSALAASGAKEAARVGPGGVPCEEVTVAPGEHRFPVSDWKKAGIDALVLLGDEGCARDAAAEAGSVGLRPLFVLGLDAARAEVDGRRLVMAAGRYPFTAHALSPEEQDWVSRYGETPSWYEALGHDAALLAAGALAKFPLDRTVDDKAVRALHERARISLGGATSPLWTTEASGFGGSTVLPREFRTAAPPEAHRTP